MDFLVKICTTEEQLPLKPMQKRNDMFWIKSLGGIFLSTEKEGIWPKNFLNYMHGLKSAILAFFQKGLGWPCPVSAALKNVS